MPLSNFVDHNTFTIIACRLTNSAISLKAFASELWMVQTDMCLGIGLPHEYFLLVPFARCAR